MSTRRWRRVALITCTVAATLVAGVAFAQWLASGTGSGYAKARSAEELTTRAAAASETLYPGGDGDLTLTITNPNPYPVTVAEVVAAGVVVSSSSECDDAGNGVAFTDQTGLSLGVPADDSTSVTLPGSVTMAESSPDACQGATFTIPVSLSGVSGTLGAGSDADADGYASTASGGSDCDDTDATVHPGADEAYNGVDDDCDGMVDEDFERTGGSQGACEYRIVNTTTGEVLQEGVEPTAETYNGIDDDCDGSVDEGAGPVYADADGDGYGDATGAGVMWIGTPPSGTVTDRTDCDDTNANIHPGSKDPLGDGIDQDCDGVDG